MKISYVLGGILLVGSSLYGEGEPPPPATQNYTLNRIETTAIAAGYQGVDATTIGVRQAGLLRDVLRDMPGVFVGGTNGINQRIYIRGMNQSALNIQIDGARQIGTAYHHTQSLLVDPDILKAVEISAGTSSVVGTSGALGGSVLFKTVSALDMLAPDQNFGFKLKSGYYSNDNQFQESAMLYGRAGGFDILGYVNWRHHDFGKTGSNFAFGKENYYYETLTYDSKTSKDVTTKTPLISTGQKTGGQGYTLNTLLKAGYRFLEVHRVELSGEYMRYDGLYPVRAEFGSDGDGINNTYTPQIYDRQNYTLSYKYNPNEDFRIEANSYFLISSLDKTRFDLKYLHRDGELWKSLTSNYGFKLNAYETFRNKNLKHNLIYGVEYYGTNQKTIKNSAIKKDGTLDPSKNPIPNKPSENANDLSAYVQYNFEYMQQGIGKLGITPGVRYEFYNVNMLKDPEAMNDFSTNTSNYNKFLGAVGLNYRFDLGVGVFANWTQVFRGPQLVEAKRLAEFGIKFVDIEKLKPESGNNFEGGFNYKGQFNKFGVDFVAKGFYTAYDNLIKDGRDKKTKNYTRVNSGAADVYGTEIALKSKIYDFQLAFGYTLTKIDYKHASGNTDKGQAISPETGDKYTINLQYFITPIDVLIGWSSLFYSDYNKKDSKSSNKFEHKPGYTVSDFYISWIPSKKALDGIEVNFGVYNLFDEAYISQTANISTKAGNGNDYEPGRSIELIFLISSNG